MVRQIANLTKRREHGPVGVLPGVVKPRQGLVVRPVGVLADARAETAAAQHAVRRARGARGVHPALVAVAERAPLRRLVDDASLEDEAAVRAHEVALLVVLDDRRRNLALVADLRELRDLLLRGRGRGRHLRDGGCAGGAERRRGGDLTRTPGEPVDAPGADADAARTGRARGREGAAARGATGMRARRERARGVCARTRGVGTRRDPTDAFVPPDLDFSLSQNSRTARAGKHGRGGLFVRFFLGTPRSPPRARVPRRDDGDHARDAGGVGVGVEPPARASPRTARRPRVRARTRFEATRDEKNSAAGGRKRRAGPAPATPSPAAGGFSDAPGVDDDGDAVDVDVMSAAEMVLLFSRGDGERERPRPLPLPPGRGGETDATSTGRTRPATPSPDLAPNPAKRRRAPTLDDHAGGLPAGGAQNARARPLLPLRDPPRGGDPLAASPLTNPALALLSRREGGDPPGPNAPAAAPPHRPGDLAAALTREFVRSAAAGGTLGEHSAAGTRGPPAGGIIKIIKPPPPPRPLGGAVRLAPPPPHAASILRAAYGPGTSPRTSRGERPRSRSSAATRRRSRRGLSTSSPSPPADVAGRGLGRSVGF